MLIKCEFYKGGVIVLLPHQIDKGFSQVYISLDNSKDIDSYAFLMTTENAKRVWSRIQLALKYHELFDMEEWDLHSSSNSELYFNPDKITTVQIVHGTRVASPKDKE